MSTNIDWFKSSYSDNIDNCVETSRALLGRKEVPVRDSKDLSPDAKILTFSTNAFATFINDVKGGMHNNGL